MASNMMLQVNLSAFRYHMISSHHRCPVPTAVKRLQHCTTDNSQLNLRSSPTIRATNVTSNETLLDTPEEPVEHCVPSLLTMSDQILSHVQVLLQTLLIVFIENILKHAVRIVDNVVRDIRKQLKEKVSETNFSPVLMCTIKQLFSKQIVTDVEISIMKRIDERTSVDDHCKNVLIQAVEQCFSRISGSINVPEMELGHRNAFRMIRQWTAYIGLGWNTPKMRANRPQQRTYSIPPKGPFAPKTPKVFTFFYRKVQKKLIDEVTALNKDSLMNTTNTELKLHQIGKNKALDTECLTKLMPSSKVKAVLSRISDRSGFIMVSSESGVLLDMANEEEVLNALEQLRGEWKQRTKVNFEVDFMNALKKA